MRIICLFTLVFFYTQIVFGQSYEPVSAPKVTVVDTFHSTYIVEDPYRWLENPLKAETKNWLEAQEELADKYLKKIHNYNFMGINKYAAAKSSLPKKEGDFYITHAYIDDIGQAALLYKRSRNQNWDILINPTYIDRKNKVKIERWAVSPDSKYVAFQYSRNGSDWAEIGVVNTRTGAMLNDNLKGLRFSGIQWLDDGFYYSTNEKSNKAGVPFNQKLYYHKLNTSQGTDKLIYTNKRHKLATHIVSVSSNYQYTIINEGIENKGITNVYYIDHESNISTIRPLIVNLNFPISVIDAHEGKFIIKTFKDDCNSMIAKIDPANPFKWETIAQPYAEAVLTRTIPFSDRLVAVYKTPFYPIISIYSYDGDVLHSLPLPEGTSVGGFISNYNDNEVYYYWQSYTIPRIVYKLNINTFENKLDYTTEVNFDFEKIEYLTVECTTADGAKLPITMVYEKGLKRNKKNPLILSTYGGYGSMPSPSFNPGIVHFVKNGGVYAYVGVRGDGSRGANWRRAGKRLKKQQAIDDLISAAEYMVAEKYTKPKKIGITGGSHGGMVVAAAGIQRPDLFGVVVPVAGVFDMLRFETSAVGVYNIGEFGSITDSTDFVNLYSYSPYHNIQEDIDYPTMLVVTGDNDERVPPYNTYKFVARLQNRKAQKNPIIMLHQEEAGHYGATTLKGQIDELAYQYGFLLNELTKKKD
ncbi:MAG: prolyl oligopeptidase family serine peptidase [Salinivirgaceae bacterium]|jgi:prolyl oligopeptidase|nr:prolyl oligopeptidase family serine peptidase [Salinivirgaceae bacterium]